ncbi:uncharacterized protein LOC124435170 [Xenia sp. Carnegie-2017]|uniref:uncharacterized protein LOC124435170 n=1 Tax=Xenia sp. Carnegie-2017 TaxID=2897299 RepID=UPI001F04EB5E|nr:uncharacterized protein LOC124435170 [Xenia sp. Carnegie-2017]
MWFVHQTSVTTVDFDGKNLPVDFVRSTGSQVQTRIKKKSITYEENVCVRMKTHFEKSKYLESFTALAKTTTYSITQRQEQRLKRKFARKRVLLCQTDLKVLFPSSECQDKEKTNRCIRSPITLLIEGEKINEELSEELTSDASSLSSGVSSSSMNSKMLGTLNILRSKFKTCSSLLSAFMQSQVQIPLEKAGNDSDVNELAKHANSFRLSTASDTTDQKRTTVPLIYNLDEHFKGLDVIDFPGVDDGDETVPELAKLLLSLTRIVVFVVDYK